MTQSHMQIEKAAGHEWVIFNVQQQGKTGKSYFKLAF